MTTGLVSREVHLRSRPFGEPALSDFALVRTAVPELGDGQVLVRNQMMSVDPFLRGRMGELPSYVPNFALGRPMDACTVGEVVASRSTDLAAGDVVYHDLGWREYSVGDASVCRRLDLSEAVSPATHLGPLGLPGLAAYVGLLDIGDLRPGDTVFVSSAAGAVGHLVGQIARLRGAARVIGSTGSDEKARYLVDELGFDEVVNYRSGPLHRLLWRAAPDGIDVYFDNVGGEHLEAALGRMNVHGRVAICGMIGQYNLTAPVPGPRNLGQAINKRLTMRGYIVQDHYDRAPAMVAEMTPWCRSGGLRSWETVVDGLENAPAAFVDLFHGTRGGRVLVRIG